MGILGEYLDEILKASGDREATRKVLVKIIKEQWDRSAKIAEKYIETENKNLNGEDAFIQSIADKLASTIADRIRSQRINVVEGDIVL